MAYGRFDDTEMYIEEDDEHMEEVDALEDEEEEEEDDEEEDDEVDVSMVAEIVDNCAENLRCCRRLSFEVF